MDSSAQEVPPGLVTSEHVASTLGVPYRSLMRWVEEELVSPYCVGDRKRAPRLWGEKHMREARVIKTLRDERVTMQAVKKAMDHLRKEGHNPFSTGKFLVLDRGAEVVKVCDDGQQISLLREPGQRLLLVVDLQEAATSRTIHGRPALSRR